MRAKLTIAGLIALCLSTQLSAQNIAGKPVLIAAGYSPLVGYSMGGAFLSTTASFDIGLSVALTGRFAKPVLDFDGATVDQTVVELEPSLGWRFEPGLGFYVLPSIGLQTTIVADTTRVVVPEHGIDTTVSGTTAVFEPGLGLRIGWVFVENLLGLEVGTFLPFEVLSFSSFGLVNGGPRIRVDIGLVLAL